LILSSIHPALSHSQPLMAHHHVRSELPLPAQTRDTIRLKKSEFTIHLISGNHGMPSDCLSAFIMEIVKQTTVEALPFSQGNLRQASQ
jgi:hypothetical protein